MTTTGYDNRGLAASSTMPFSSSAAAGSGFDTSSTIPNFTQITFDQLERPVAERFYAGAGTQLRWTTTTSYDGTKTVVAPQIGGQTRTRTDLYGRTVGIDEFLGAATGTPYATATYTYDDLDQLTAITDAAGNTITYSYDLAGRRTGMADPDAGTWSYGYDANGNQTLVVDADPASANLVTEYDQLNRPTKRRTGSVSGPVVAEWLYDPVGGKGFLDRSVRHDLLGDFTSSVTGYDSRGRPTGRSLTVPAGVGLLAGTYSVGYTYDGADRQTTVAYPAIGGLAAETVTTAYDPTGGGAETLTGAVPYVSASTFDSLNRPVTRTLGATGTAGTVTRTYSYDIDQRLSGWAATQGSAGTVIQDDRIGRDALGNVTSRWDARAGVNQRECFGYDARSRLTSAYTTTNSACGTANTSGPVPYNHTYGYAVDGKLTSRNQGAGALTYTYPPQGGGAGSKPHAVTDITGTTNDCNGAGAGSPDYCYDPNGNLTGRPGSTSTTQTLTWNPEHQLQQVDDNGTPTGGETTFVYDPDGQRLLRKTPTNTTLYLEGHELTLTGTTVTAKRYYTLGNTVVAVRDSAGSGSLNYLLGDQLGSTTMSVDASTGATQTQRFLPYGAPRSGSIGATDRGWIGQTKDASTGLKYLNARYYDPTIGRFTAVDPLADLADPGSLDGYGYAGGSPVTSSDPSGLLRDCECGDTSYTPLLPVAPPAVPVPIGGAAASPDAIQQQIDQWVHDQAVIELLIGRPGGNYAQYLDWNGRCAVFEEHYCVGAQALALGGSVSLAEQLMGQCTIGNLCRSDGVVRDRLTEFFLFDLPAAILTGTVVKGLPGLVRAGALTGDRGGIGGAGQFLSKESQIAVRFGATTKEVRTAIHAAKTNLPRGGTVRNPDVVVDAATGEIYPQLSGGVRGDSIGNILDYLPGAG